MGYGHDIYKLALLTMRQREDLVSELKIMPGHKAKLAGFFTVIDELYPRQMVVDQVKAYAPSSYNQKKNRLQSANKVRSHLGP